MLFDLRGRGRRRTVQGIYLALALLMGGGLVFFGIGGATNGGLLNAVNDKGSGSAGGLSAQVKAAEKRVALAPNDPAAWANLTHVDFLVSGQGANYDINTSSFTAVGRTALAKVKTDWQHYMSLSPNPADSDLASQMVEAFGPSGIADFGAAAQAAEIVAGARPSTAIYAQLSAYAYAAGQTRRGDLAAAKAVSLAPAAQRAALTKQLAATKKQAPKLAAQAKQAQQQQQG